MAEASGGGNAPVMGARRNEECCPLTVMVGAGQHSREGRRGQLSETGAAQQAARLGRCLHDGQLLLPNQPRRRCDIALIPTVSV